MNSSENTLRQIQLFVTDADGTLLGQKPEFEQYRAFRLKIDELRTRGAKWVVCTGRSLRSFNRIFRPMRMFGIEPDYVIARHAYIYERSRHGYWPHWFWNVRVLWLQSRAEVRVRRALPMLRRAVLSRNPFAHIAFSSSQRVCFRFDDEGAANFGAEIIRIEAKPYKYLQIFQFPGEVDVRTVPFTKGLAVAELARHLDIMPARILVVGDGHNDISMMEINAECRTACPGNAAPEVIEAVHRTGGHIASERALSGVMEIIGAYETGRVHSELPPDFHEFKEGANPVRLPSHTGRESSRTASVLLFLAVLYTTLLVLASFHVVPGLGVIEKPYQMLVRHMEHLFKHALK